MIKTVSILGSTGSIGRQTLDVAEKLGIRVVALTADRNVDRMAEQCRKYRPLLAVMASETAGDQLREKIGDLPVAVRSGRNGMLEAASLPQADTVVMAVMGMAGLQPTLAAIAQKKRIALANKETLVCAGELVMQERDRAGAEIVPVDSEHSAIFQCLAGNHRSQVKRLILTASGGPFYGWTPAQLQTVTKQQALHHPNWEMGPKITVDSATMMNKGLEIIEAMHLFAMPYDQISVVVHRQSIIHSMVEYVDGTVMAQLGVPDMRTPIQFALTCPDRLTAPAEPLDFLSCGPLTFEAPDPAAFPCLQLAMHAAARGGTACAVLNGANEAATALFLEEKIGFCDIAELVAHAMQTVSAVDHPSLDQILEADAAARSSVAEAVQRKKLSVEKEF